MKRKGNFAKGCSIWLVTVIVAELLMLLLIPGCGLFQLSALNFVSGNAIKSFFPSRFPPPITNSQGVSAFASQGILYASSSPYSYAIRMSDGRLLQKTENTFTTADGGIYYTTANNDPNTLLAVRVLDGMLLWKFTPGGSIDSIQAIDDVVYIMQGDRMTGLNASTGKLLWHFQQFDPVCTVNNNCALSSPQVLDGIVFVTDGSEMFALKENSGALLWNAPYYYSGPPLIAKETISLLTASNIALGFRASDGKTLWQFQFPAAPATFFHSSTDGTHYFYYDDAHLYTLDAETGKLLWHWSERRSAIDRAPSAVNTILHIIVSPDALYLDTANALVAIRLADGKELWSQNWTALAMQSSANTSDTLNRYAPPGSQFRLLGASDGQVFIQHVLPSLSSTGLIALSAARGNTVWQLNIPITRVIGTNTPVPQNAPYISASTDPPILLNSSTLYLTYSVLVTDGPPPAHWVISIDQANQPAYTSTYTVYTLAFNARNGSLKWQNRQAVQYTGCC